jgi:small subunit ribosomal protein S15
MSLAEKTISQIAEEFGKSAQDTGNPAVQIALLTQRINHLTEHLKQFQKDFACRRGLMMMVGQRRRMLNYYKKKMSLEQYKKLLTELNLRK